MKFLARHLTIDMYNCKMNKLTDTELLQQSLHAVIETSNFTVLNTDIKVLAGQQTTAFILLKEGHISIHTYPDLKYAAVDVFLCGETSQPEKAAKALRKVLKPEKTKMTYLKRGDFGSVKDMKPKIKTKTAHLRRIQNTGAKVIRVLSRRKANKT